MAVTLFIVFVSAHTASAERSGVWEYTVSGVKARITRYYGSGGDVVIPSVINGFPVTSINYGAFKGCTSLTSVTIPDSVTSIGGSAFYDCSSITEFSIGSGVTSIGRNAFSGCSSLRRVDISDLAAWCAIAFSDNPVWYAHNLYYNGELLTKLVIPEGVTSISSRAFENCASITYVDVPLARGGLAEDYRRDQPVLRR